MKIPAFLNNLTRQKTSLLSEDQKRTIEVGRQQFQKLIEKKLTIPVVFL